MKKKIARISTRLLLVFSFLIMFDIKCEAADGIIQISDASGAVGDNIDVAIKVDAGGDALGDCEAALAYDQAMLEFVEGTFAEKSDEGIFLAQYGTGTETEFIFNLQFRILEEGKSDLTLTGSTAYLYSDEVLNLHATGGMISSEKIVGGEPVDINGTSYYFYDDFSEALVLNGFTKSTFDYEGYTHNVIIQDLTGRVAAYFVKEDNNPTLMLYDESTSSFVPAEMVSISNNYYLIVLGNVSGSGVPDEYAETTIEINGTVLPAWQNMNETDYFLVYALSSEGFEGFYQYDSREGTYQRYTKPSSTKIIEDNKFDNVILEKISEFITGHLIYILAGAVMLILVMIIIIIIMSSMVGKRNAELEDLYSELEDRDLGSADEDDTYYAEEDDMYDAEDDVYDDADDAYDYKDDMYDDDAYDYDDDMYDDDVYDYDDDTYYDEDDSEYDVDFIDL